MTAVVLSLGSNIGERTQHLENAIEDLAKYMQIMKCSTIYETDPMYVVDQDKFLNQIVIGHTDFSPHELHAHIKNTETNLGRTVTFTNGPRVIDIDILYFGEHIINTDDLIIPHPRIAERLFVLKPLSDVNPHWRCPVTQLTTHEMYIKLLENKI